MGTDVDQVTVVVGAVARARAHRHRGSRPLRGPRDCAGPSAGWWRRPKVSGAARSKRCSSSTVRGDDQLGELSHGFNDTVERRRLAEAEAEDRGGALVAQNARLSELDHLKEIFLATVSHELRRHSRRSSAISNSSGRRGGPERRSARVTRSHGAECRATPPAGRGPLDIGQLEAGRWWPSTSVRSSPQSWLCSWSTW